MMGKLVALSIFLWLFLGSQVLAAELEGLILYLPFDEGSGGTAYDKSGCGNDGDITGAEWVDAGKVGKCLEFDGSSFVEVPSSDSLEALVEEMTIAVWIKPELTGSGWQGIVTKGNDVSEHLELLINVAGYIHRAQQFTTGRAYKNVGAAGTLSAGEWQHLAVTLKPGEWVTYINGEAVDTQVVNGDMVPDGLPLVVGDERPMNRLFQGLIDEVAVFNRALSEDEIKEIMEGIDSLLSVESMGKIATTWAATKQQ